MHLPGISHSCCVALAFALLAAGFTPAASLAATETSLAISGDPGEPVTGGASFRWTGSTATFTSQQTAGRVTTRVVGAGGDWTMMFSSLPDRNLSGGSYEAWSSTLSTREAAFSIRRSDGGSTCIPPSGRFQVRKIGYTSTGSVRSLWVRWDAGCTVTGPRHHGDLRFNADTSLWQETPGDVWAFAGDSARFTTVAHAALGGRVRFDLIALPRGGVFVDHGDGTATLTWKSDPVPFEAPTSGLFPFQTIAIDEFGNRDTAMTVVHTGPMSELAMSAPASHPLAPDGGVVLRRNGSAQISLKTPLGTSAWDAEMRVQGRIWNAKFQCSGSLPPAEAFYYPADAARTGWLKPWLNISMNGYSCIDTSSWFEVRRLQYDASGVLRGWWLRFGGRCGGAAPGLVADVRYNVDTTLYATAPGNVLAKPGEWLRWSCSGVSTIGRAVTVRAEGLPPGTSVTGIGASTLSFECRPEIAVAGEWIVTTIATDDRGVEARARTRVIVRTPAVIAVRTSSANWDLPNQNLRATDETYPFSAYWDESNIARAGVSAPDARLDLNFTAGWPPYLAEGRYPLWSQGNDGEDRLSASGTTSAGSHFWWLDRGSLFVRRLVRGENHTITSLWATWSARTGGVESLWGEIRMQVDTTIVIDAPAYSVVERGRALRVPVSATRAGGGALELRAESLPVGASFTPGPANAGTLDWPVAGDVGQYRVQLIARAPDGIGDTLDIVLRVVAPRLFAQRLRPERVWMGPPPGDYRGTAADAEFPNRSDAESRIAQYSNFGDNRWSATFISPNRRRITPGVYSDLQWAEGVLPEPLATFVPEVNGSPLAGPNGMVHVRKIDFGDRGWPTVYWLKWDFLEDGVSVPGELRFGDPDTSLYIDAPADQWGVPDSTIVLHAYARSTIGERTAWTQIAPLPEGASVEFPEPGHAKLRWVAPSQLGALSPIVWRAVDAQGRVDSAFTHLTVVPPASLVTDRQAYDPYGRGNHHEYSAPATLIAIEPLLDHGVIFHTVGMAAGWWFWLTAPNDERFETGRTYDAMPNYVPDQPYSQATMHVLDYRGDQTWYGRWPDSAQFTVRDVRYDEAGHVSAIRFTFRLVHWDSSAVWGEARYGTFPGVVATLVDRVRAVNGAAGISLAWRVRSSLAEHALERLAPGESEWLTIQRGTPDGSGLLEFEDRDAHVPGVWRYRLRVGGREGAVLDEVAVTVRSRLSFALRTVTPNPAKRRIALQLGSSDGHPVDVRVLDLAGRSVARTSFGRSEDGRDLSWDLPPGIAPGVYVLSATAGGRTTSKRFVIVR